MYLLYNLLLWICSPALLCWAVWRGASGRLDGLRQRLGFFSQRFQPDGAPVVWLHAVSLGEMKVAGMLAAQLRERAPAVHFVLTASTRTGYAEAQRIARATDIVLHPPSDYRWVCRRFLRRLRPDLLVVLETELWPNLFREAKRSGARLVIANARISDRSFPRYRATRYFWRAVLSQVDTIYAQSPRDAERFAALGAAPSRVQMTGNLKYSISPSATPLTAALAETISAAKVGPVVIAGSTMPGEEAIMIDTFLDLRRDFPALWMILAPRHPERSAMIAEQIRAAGVPLTVRSAWTPGQPVAPGIFLLDTTGELASLYQLATASFIGGTLVPAGGHNILEPAYFACPVVIGPSMDNFREIAAQFLAANAVLQIGSAAKLASTLRHLFQYPDEARRMGQAARTEVERSRQQATAIADALADALPKNRNVSVPEAVHSPTSTSLDTQRTTEPAAQGASSAGNP